MVDIIQFVFHVCVLMFPQYYKKNSNRQSNKKKDPTRNFEFVLLRKVFFHLSAILELSTSETATFFCNKNYRPLSIHLSSYLYLFFILSRAALNRAAFLNCSSSPFIVSIPFLLPILLHQTLVDI